MSVMRQYRKRAEALVADSPFFSNPSGDLQVHFFRHELIKQRALLLYFHRQLNTASGIVQEMRIKFLQAKKQVQNRNELLDQLRHTLFQELILSKEHAAALSSSAGSSSGAAAASSASSSGTSSHSR